MILKIGDYIQLIDHWAYYLIVDPMRIGLQQREQVTFPTPVDQFISEKLDKDRVYWLSRNGNTLLLRQLLDRIKTKKMYHKLWSTRQRTYKVSDIPFIPPITR